MNPLIIPYQSLQPDTLQAMLEDFVTRDGTDCGDQAGLRVAQVLRQLRSGKAVIVYDGATETFTILPKDQLVRQGWRDVP